MTKVVGINTGTGGGSGDSIWTEEDSSISYTNQNDANQQLALTWTDDKTLELYAKRVTGGETQALNIRSNSGTNFVVNGLPRIVIGSDGSVDMPTVYDGFNTSNSANIYMSSDGKLHRSTTATYSTQEVDEKLAIKDKLIEKLSARLDSLELKFKALK